MPNDQDQLLNRIKRLPAELRLLIEKRIELYVIEFGERLSESVAKALTIYILFVVLLISLIFALFSFSFFIGEILGNTAMGFAVTSVLMMVIALVLYLLAPDFIESRIRNIIASGFVTSGKEDGHLLSDEATQNQKDEAGNKGMTVESAHERRNNHSGVSQSDEKDENRISAPGGKKDETSENGPPRNIEKSLRSTLD